MGSHFSAFCPGFKFWSTIFHVPSWSTQRERCLAGFISSVGRPEVRCVGSVGGRLRKPPISLISLTKWGWLKIAFTTWTQPSDILGSCHSCCKVQSRVYLRFGQTLPLLASNLNPEETTADNIPLMQAGVQRCSLVQKNSSTGEKSRFVLAKSIQFLVFFVSSSAPNQQVLPLPKHLVAFWFPDTQLPRLSHAFAGQILGWTAAVTFPKTWGFLEKPLQWQGNNCSSMLATLRIKNIGKKKLRMACSSRKIVASFNFRECLCQAGPRLRPQLFLHGCHSFLAG